MRSWWWVEVPHETCRAVSRYNKLCNVASCWIYSYIRILLRCTEPWTLNLVEISYRSFGTNYRSRFQGGSLKTGPIGCPETSVTNYHYSLRNNPEESSPQLLRSGNLKWRFDEVWLNSNKTKQNKTRQDKTKKSAHAEKIFFQHSWCCRLRLKCDGTRAETRFPLAAKRTRPFKSAGASVNP